MGSTTSRWAMLICGAGIVFGVTVAVGLQVLPGPHTETDFLVVGSAATLLSLGVVFGVLIGTWVKSPELFFKRRQAQAREDQEKPDSDNLK
ncbi:MAG: hypothetical protein HY858_09565 [Candidatus Solibacter usitatus]|nr:hypothetical protein [Candidatus Solibacter usitatus]